MRIRNHIRPQWESLPWCVVLFATEIWKNNEIPTHESDAYPLVKLSETPGPSESSECISCSRCHPHNATTNEPTTKKMRSSTENTCTSANAHTVFLGGVDSIHEPWPRSMCPAVSLRIPHATHSLFPLAHPALTIAIYKQNFWRIPNVLNFVHFIPFHGYPHLM